MLSKPVSLAAPQDVRYGACYSAKKELEQPATERIEHIEHIVLLQSASAPAHELLREQQLVAAPRPDGWATRPASA